MFSITIDEILSIVGIIFLILLGVLGTISPMTIAKLTTVGPRVVFSRVFGKENVPEKALRAIELINDKEAYSAEFGCQLLFIRMIGIIALIMVCGMAMTYLMAIASSH